MLAEFVLPLIGTKLDDHDESIVSCSRRRPPLAHNCISLANIGPIPARGLPPLPRAGDSIVHPRSSSCSAVRQNVQRRRSRSASLVGQCQMLPRPLSAAKQERCSTPKSVALQGRSLTPLCKEKCKIQQVRESWALSQALAKAEQEAAKQRRAEELAQAEETIKSHLLVQGETEASSAVVLELMKEHKQLLKAVCSSDVNGDIVDRFRRKAKRSEFEGELKRYFPDWHLTEKQHSEIIDHILEAHSRIVLVALFRACGQDHREVARSTALLYSDAFDAAVGQGAAAFHCSICLAPLVTKTSGGVDASAMWLAKNQKTEHWSKEPCGHAFCRTCMGTWAETKINDQHRQIRCPAEGCSYCLWDQDIRELVPQLVFERHQEHKNADYLQHLKDAMKGDPSLKNWMKSHCRPCPDCHVVVSRSEGCDQMMCVCGSRFCYACGFKKCRCGHKHKDIWNPRVQSV